MLAAELNWKIEADAPQRLMRRLRAGRYEGVCRKTGKRVRIDLVGEEWELYLGQKFISSEKLKRVALKKTNEILQSEDCKDE
jgi:hypothetical protein